MSGTLWQLFFSQLERREEVSASLGRGAGCQSPLIQKRLFHYYLPRFSGPGWLGSAMGLGCGAEGAVWEAEPQRCEAPISVGGEQRGKASCPLGPGVSGPHHKRLMSAQDSPSPGNDSVLSCPEEATPSLEPRAQMVALTQSSKLYMAVS